MSQKKEFAKLFVVEAVGKNNLDILYEILHPEYYSEKFVESKDRFWNKHMSYLRSVYSRSMDIDDYFDPEDKTPLVPGIEAAKERLYQRQGNGNPMPPLNMKIHSIVEEENQVVVMVSQSFTHDKNYYGINPTYLEIVYNASYMFTFEEDKIVKTNLVADSHQLLTRMGAMILSKGDEEQIQQYLEVLRHHHLIFSSGE